MIEHVDIHRTEVIKSHHFVNLDLPSYQFGVRLSQMQLTHSEIHIIRL
jgi:hypothetical protein